MVAPILIVAIISAMIGGASLITTAVESSQGLDADQCYVVFKHSKMSSGVDMNFLGADGEDNMNNEEFTDEHDGTFEQISNGSSLDSLSIKAKQENCISRIFLHCGATAGGSSKAMVDVKWDYFTKRMISDKADPSSYTCGEGDKKGIRVGGSGGLSKIVIKGSALACPPEKAECVVKNIEAHK